MSQTYTIESYDSIDGNRTINTTEYRFNDGTRFARVTTQTPKPYGFGYFTNTRVLRADFEGDKEHRSTVAELAIRMGQARQVTTPTEPADAPQAYQIEAGYEEQAVPLTDRQIAVLEALHANLDVTFEVLPPVKQNRDLTASAQWGVGNKFLVEVDPEGYIDRIAVRYDIAGHVEWVDLSRSDRSTHFYDRVKFIAREARLATPVESVGTNAAE